MTKPRPKLTPHDLQRAADLHAKGMSWEEVKDATGYHGASTNLRNMVVRAQQKPQPLPKAPVIWFPSSVLEERAAIVAYLRELAEPDGEHDEAWVKCRLAAAGIERVDHLRHKGRRHD